MNHQTRVGQWILKAFGAGILHDRRERATRVLEEAIELAQAEDVSSETARLLLDRVYRRPPGDPTQEAAQVAVTLLGWAQGADWRLDMLTETEIERIERPEVMARIVARQIEKHGAGVGVLPE